MKITFAIPGRFKSKELSHLVDYYLTLAGRFSTVTRTTLREDQDPALLQLLERRGPRAFVTILDEKGTAFTSRKFADKVTKIRDGSHTEWIIAVGGAHGYSKELTSRAQLLWSLSPLTFPHEMAAAVAAEQVFRVLSIMNNHPYHND